MDIRAHQFHRNTVSTAQKGVVAFHSKSEESRPLEPTDAYSGPLTTYVDPADSLPATLPTAAPPALERPVVFVHGFTGDPHGFDPMTDWLSSGGKNKDGGIVEPGKLDQLDGSANLFTIRFSRSFNGIEKNSEELKRTIEAICKATGQPEVDLVVHSLGGLNTRDYLREPDEKVKRFVMLGTPNHGSQLANLELIFREKFGFPIKPPEDDPEVRVVLNQLRVDRGNENPYLRELNNGWPQQRAKAEVLTIAGAGIPTLTGGVGITVKGDGVVARKSVELDGVETKSAWFKTHNALLKTAAVMENAASFLATGRTLSTDENIYDSPADEIRAKELLAQEAQRDQQAEKAKETSNPGKATEAMVQQAAQLPVLDPAFQFGLGMGVLAALMGGPNAITPLVTLDVSSTQGQNALAANYTVDMERSHDPVRGSGTNNHGSFAEKANLVEGKLYWNSQSGALSSGMVMQVNEDERSIQLAGQLSGVDANLRIAPFLDSQGNIEGIETKGTLNGEQYFMKSTIDVEGLLSGKPSRRDGAMHVVGLVNGKAVEKSYDVSVHRSRATKDLHLTAKGTGLNAGQAQSVSVDVAVKNRD
jgi:pimeloyl-ACP methyl ester carboxylesterase